MTDKLFKKALNFVLAREGGYVNNPNDRGGATNKGITQGTYNAWLKSKGKATKDVKNITNSEVEQIYYTNYWLKAGCDKMSDKFAIICFDTAVNMGVGRVPEFLKKAEFKYEDSFLLARALKYNEFAKNASQRTFLHGWFNRLQALKDFIDKM